MALQFSFNNGMVSGPNGFQYDLGKYMGSLSSSNLPNYLGGGGTQMLAPIYEAYNQYAHPNAYAGDQFQLGDAPTDISKLTDANDLSAAGQALLPQLQQWGSTYKQPTPTQSLAQAGATPTTTNTATPQATTGVSAIPSGNQMARGTTFDALRSTGTATPGTSSVTGRQGTFNTITGGGGLATAGSMPTAPVSTADARAGRAAVEAQRTGQGGANTLARAGTLQTIINSGLQAVTGGGGSATGTPSGLVNNPIYSSGTQFEGGLPPLRTRTPKEEIELSDQYRIQADELEKRMNRRFAASGRSKSTYADREISREQANLLANEVRYQDETQYQRNMEINKLLYDRKYQDNVLNYEREFRENERKYGREKAEEILAYERAFREDARDYDRVRYLVDLGFNAAQSGASA